MIKDNIIEVIKNIDYQNINNKNFKKIDFINGLTITFNSKGQFHSIGNQPAIKIQTKDLKNKFYFKNNLLHRKNGKVAILSNLNKYYFVNGKKISKNKAKSLRRQIKIKKKFINF